MDIITRLESTIADRIGADPSTSYVAQLSAKGLPVMARKLGEEAVEAVIASLAGSDEEVIGECADIIFHMLVILGHKDLKFNDITNELARREGLSGLAEKAQRKEG